MDNNKDAQNLIDEEKIRLINEAYDGFLRELRKIEKNRDEKIAVIIKKIEERQIKEIKQGIKNTV